MASNEQTISPHGTLTFTLRALLMFALAGALYWAMRGANGFGGISGAVVPGLMWGLIWTCLESSRGKHAVWVAAACAAGFGIGGFNGYGQFIAWISGQFHLIYPNNYITIAPWRGYVWLFACGAGWGGVGGQILAAALQPEKSRTRAVPRFLCLPAGAAAGYAAVALNPALFAPFYSRKLYDLSFCGDCAISIAVINIVGAFMGAFLLALVYDLLLRRRRALKISLVCAAGFGLAFAVPAPLHLLGKSLPGYDWWKFWEMLLGATAGASIAVVYFFNKRDGEQAGGKTVATAGAIVDDLAVFLVFNWASYNCTRVLAEYLKLDPGHSARWIVFFCLLAVSLFLFVMSIIRNIKRVKTNVIFKTIYIHLAFSLMAFIVIFPNKKLLGIFIALSAAVLVLLLTVKQQAETAVN